jgi:hypothetical protein
VDVDAVEQRAAHAAAVALHGQRVALAMFRGVGGVAAGALLRCLFTKRG